LVAWKEDIPEGEPYKDAGVIDEQTAGVIEDFGMGHLVDPDKTWSRPEYAYRAAKKIIGTNYFLLVKLDLGRNSDGTRRIGWTAILTRQPVDQIIGRITT
jgi:hypothetical protein